MKLALAALAVFLLLPALAHAAAIDPLVCPVDPVRSYMDVLLDPSTQTANVYVYNRTPSFDKEGVRNALVLRMDLTNGTASGICYGVTSDGSGGVQPGFASFAYDPAYVGCLDYWYIFCPRGDAAGNLAARQQCLNGTALPQSIIAQNVLPCSASSGGTPQTHANFLPSHNELYLCNNPPRDFAPLCWPLMLIFGLLIGASYMVGRNPLAAFDFSAPRMNRGRQYSMRVQQKSFDLLGYVMASSSLADTAGKFGGLATGAKDVHGEDGAKIGTKNSAGEVHDAEGKHIGNIDKDGKLVDTKSGNQLVTKGGSIVGYVEGGRVIQERMVDGKTKKIDIGTYDKNTKRVVSEGRKEIASGNITTQVSNLGFASYAPTSLLTNMVGMAATPLARAAGGLLGVGENKNANQQTERALIPLEKAQLNSLLKSGKLTDEQKDKLNGILSSGKITKADDAMVRAWAGSFGFTTNFTKGAELKEAARGEMLSSQGAGGKGGTGDDFRSNVAKTVSVTAGTSGFISAFSAPDPTAALANFFSDKPFELSENADRLAKLSIDRDIGGIFSLIWSGMKESVGFDAKEKGWAATIFTTFKALSALSFYAKGMGGLLKATGSRGAGDFMGNGIKFVEDFNNSKFFSIAGVDFAKGSVISWFDPEFKGGSGALGIDFLVNPLAEKISGMVAQVDAELFRPGGALGFDLKEIPTAAGNYIEGANLAVVRTGEGKFGLMDLEGNAVSAKDAAARLERMKLKGDEARARDELVAALLSPKNGLKSDLGTILDRMDAGDKFVKADWGGKLSVVSKSEIDDALTRQIGYNEGRARALSVIQSNAGAGIGFGESQTMAKLQEYYKDGMPLDALRKELDDYGSGKISKLSDNAQRSLMLLGLVVEKEGPEGKYSTGLGIIDLSHLEKKDRGEQIYGSWKNNDAKSSTQSGLLGEINNLISMKEDYYKSQSIGALGYQIEAIGMKNESLKSARSMLSAGDTSGYLAEQMRFNSYRQFEMAAIEAYQSALSLSKGGAAKEALEILEAGMDREKAENLKNYLEVREQKANETLANSETSQTEKEIARLELVNVGLARELAGFYEAKASEIEVESPKERAGRRAEAAVEPSKVDQTALMTAKLETVSHTIMENMFAKLDVLRSTAEIINASGKQQLQASPDAVASFASQVDRELRELPLWHEDAAARMNEFKNEVVSPVARDMKNVSLTATEGGSAIGESIRQKLEESLKAATRYSTAFMEGNEGKSDEAMIKFDSSRVELYTELVKVRNYDGAGRKEVVGADLMMALTQSVQEYKSVLDERQELVEKIGKAGGTEKQKLQQELEQNAAKIESFSVWMDDFARKDSTLYITSNEYLAAQVKANLGEARWGSHYLNQPEQQVLERISAQSGLYAGNNVMPRMPWETYSGYLYGGMVFSIPQAWSAGAPKLADMPSMEREAPVLDLERAKALELGTETRRTGSYDRIKKYVMSLTDPGKPFGYKGEVYDEKRAEKYVDIAVNYAEKQKLFGDEWKAGDEITPGQEFILSALARDSYRDPKLKKYDKYTAETISTAIHDPETGKSEVAGSLAKLKKNQNWYENENARLHDIIVEGKAPDEVAPQKKKSKKK